MSKGRVNFPLSKRPRVLGISRENSLLLFNADCTPGRHLLLRNLFKLSQQLGHGLCINLTKSSSPVLACHIRALVYSFAFSEWKKVTREGSTKCPLLEDRVSPQEHWIKRNSYFITQQGQSLYPGVICSLMTCSNLILRHSGKIQSEHLSPVASDPKQPRSQPLRHPLDCSPVGLYLKKSRDLPGVPQVSNTPWESILPQMQWHGSRVQPLLSCIPRVSWLLLLERSSLVTPAGLRQAPLSFGAGLRHLASGRVFCLTWSPISSMGGTCWLEGHAVWWVN